MTSTRRDQRDAGAIVRIWMLQYGPCWCRSPRTASSSFDYVRLRRTAADLGTMEENLLLVSERVIDGTAAAYRQVHDEVPDPKLVISLGSCPTGRGFWEELPSGWTPVADILPVDIHVDECINGKPEALTVAILGHVLKDETRRSDFDTRDLALSTDREQLEHA